MLASTGATETFTIPSAASASVIECAMVKPVTVISVRLKVPASSTRHTMNSRWS
jgi:hypothetical protein